MNGTEETKLPSLARNTALNFLGQFIPLLVGIGATPVIISGLGKARFGILSLIWVVIGYFSLLDLGLGKATTKFFSELLSRKEIDRLPVLFWSSFIFNLLVGIAGGTVMALLTPFLIRHVFNIPAELVSEARASFFILSVSVPLVVMTTTLRGVLEGGQRFDLVNAVKIPSSSLTFLIPAFALPFHWKLPLVVFLLLLSRLATMTLYGYLCFRAYPSLKKTVSPDRQTAISLLTFGGWVTISNIVNPFLVYLDRFFIGSLLTMEAVAFYTAPYEVVTRLWILPLSFVVTLFPLFSALGTQEKEKLGDLYAQSSKYLLLVMGPLVLVITLFAKHILRLWLGGEFAQKSTVVLQILAVGVFINSLINIPFSLIQGLGRPDITAKFHLLELPFYIGLVRLLVGHWGIEGAALAWGARVTADAVLVFWAAQKLIPTSLSAFSRNGFRRAAASLTALAVTSLFSFWLARDLAARVVIVSACVVVFGLAVWKYLLNTQERQALVAILRFKRTSGSR